MRKLLLIPLLALSACGAKTPEDRYYSATNVLIAVLKPVSEYAKACTPKPLPDPCHAKVAAVQPKVAQAKVILEQADKVFVTHDSAYYDLSLTAMQNLTNDLAAFVKGEL